MADIRDDFLRRMRKEAKRASSTIVSKLAINDAGLNDGHFKFLPMIKNAFPRDIDQVVDGDTSDDGDGDDDDGDDDKETREPTDANYPVLPDMIDALSAAIAEYETKFKVMCTFFLMLPESPYRPTERPYPWSIPGIMLLAYYSNEAEWNGFVEATISEASQGVAGIPIVAYDKMRTLINHRPIIPPLKLHQRAFEDGFALVSTVSEIWHRVNVELRTRLTTYWAEGDGFAGHNGGHNRKRDNNLKQDLGGSAAELGDAVRKAQQQLEVVREDFTRLILDSGGVL